MLLDAMDLEWRHTEKEHERQYSRARGKKSNGEHSGRTHNRAQDHLTPPQQRDPPIDYPAGLALNVALPVGSSDKRHSPWMIG